MIITGALSYAELGTAIPESGGEHAYLMYTYRPMSKSLGQIPAFLYIWVSYLDGLKRESIVNVWLTGALFGIVLQGAWLRTALRVLKLTQVHVNMSSNKIAAILSRLL